MGVEIVTDSASDIPDKILKEQAIEVIPMVTNFGERSYRDRIDLGMEKFLQMLQDKNLPHPTTSAASPGEVLEIYKKFTAKNIISIHLGSEFSEMWKAAKIAANSSSENKVEVFDTGIVSLGEGFMVINAARWAKEGLNCEEILKRLNDMRKRTTVLVSLNTLEYAKRGGRINNLKALVGSVLNLKPILEMNNNEIIERERLIRTRKQSLTTLVENVKDYAPLEMVGVMHSGAEKEAGDVADRISGFFDKEIILSEVCPAVSAHAGPEAIGVALVRQGIDK